MASKELIAQAAKAMEERRKELIAQPLLRIYPQLAQAAISTIFSALQEPTEEMIEAGCDQYDFGSPMTQGELLGKEWNAMLHASALGEQSDGE